MKADHYLKKIFICFMILLMCGCTNSNKKEQLKQQETVQKDEEKDFVEPYVDENPIQLGLYVHENGVRTLMDVYSSDFVMYQDMVSFEVYYTKEAVLNGSNQKKLWNQYYLSYADIDSYKIGYYISFEAGDFKVSKTILNPSDVESFFDYIQIYLYDDIHQESSWYDHISQDEVTEETRFTSIKLTASTKIDEITTSITLKAFTYDSDDFDQDGNYRGNSNYQVVIQRR